MLREFQDEINKLRAQLQSINGGNMDPNMMDNWRNDKGQTLQQIVYKNNPDEMKELEKKLETEKEEIKRKADQERRLIENQKQMAEDEKKVLLEKIKAKEEDEEKIRLEQTEMIKKIKSMEGMVVKGTKAMEKAEKQEKILQQT